MTESCNVYCRPESNNSQGGDELLALNEVQKYGTSVDEQRQILEEIQKQSRRRSISRNRAGENSDTPYRHRAKSSYSDYNSVQEKITNQMQEPQLQTPHPRRPERRNRQNSGTYIEITPIGY